MNAPLKSALALVLMLSACAVPPVGDRPAPILQGPIPTLTETPASRALACLAARPDAQNPDLRIAVGEIPDRTGRFDYEDLGSFVTQGATYMMISALAAAGIRQVNRSTVGIAEWELEQSINQRLGEGRPVTVGDQVLTYRPIPRGAFTGSTHYITGAITELDFNVFQRSNEAMIGGIGAGMRVFVARVAVDLAVTDTKTTEIVLSRSYRKQVVGYEIQANIFRIFDIGSGVGQIAGEELIDVNLATQPNEPLQGSVRWVLESAAYDIASELLGTGALCDAHLNEAERERRQARRGRIPLPRPAEIDAPAGILDSTDPDAAAVDGSLPEPQATPLECRFIAGRQICANFPGSAPNPHPGLSMQG